MKDIELPPLPRRSLCEFDGAVEIDLYTKEQMQAYARAAVEADRAQRVPDVEAALDRFESRERGIPQAHIAAQLASELRALLAATPAPAQQECWCETCDLAQGNPLGRTRMSLCPECGDKRCPRAKHHDNACAQHQEPPQQERKPMTYEIVREGFAACPVGGINEELERFAALVAAAERDECAKVCKDEMIDEEQCNDDVAYNAGCNDCAAAIRARGTK